MRPEMADNAMRMVFDPGMAVAAGVMIALFAVMGYVSLRFLRKQPDFPEKAQMLAGAKWGWVVLAGFVVVQELVIYVGGRLTSYPLTFYYGAPGLLFDGLIISALLLPRQASGLLAGAPLFFAWASKGPFDLAAWLARDQRVARRRWVKPVVVGMLILLVAGHLIVIAQIYPMEHSIAQNRQDDELVAALQEQLDSGVVLDVVATPSPYERTVWIRVKEDTTAQESQRLIQQMKRELAAHDRPERWEIRVCIRNKGILATSEYLPGPDQP